MGYLISFVLCGTKIRMVEEVIEAKPEIQKDPVIEEMLAAGLHFGHKTSKTHPKMKPYITGVRNTIHIINLEKTSEKLQEALEVLKKLVGEGKVVLLVGTKIQMRSLVKETAEACGVPYVSERWIGGLLTNFDTIAKRLAHLKELEEKKASGEFEKYTKKEQHDLADEIESLEAKFGGIKSLKKLPDAVFIVDLDENGLASREARKRGVLTIGVSDTNTDPTIVDYAIPANDDAISSVSYILGKVREAVLGAKPQAPTH